MVQIVIYDMFNQAYELTDRHNAPRSSAAQRHRYDACFTFSLVSRLAVSHQQWLHIMRRALGRLPEFHSNHPGEIYQAITKSVMRGDLAIYQLPGITDFGALRGKADVGLCIIRGPDPHCATDLTPEICNSPEAAKQLLDEMGISTQSFLAHLNGKSLYSSYQQQNPLQDALNLLASGELLAYKVRLPVSAPTPKPVEYLPPTAADKPVTLAPETRPQTKTTAPEPATIEKASPQTENAPQMLTDADPLSQAAEAANSLERVSDAALPLGSKRLQFNQPKNPAYQPLRNEATCIDGINYSGHAIDRMQDRGIMPSVVRNTIETGTPKSSYGNTTIYSDPVNKVKVVVNADGKVVTAEYGD